MSRIIPITGKFILAALLTCPLYVWGRKAQKKKELDQGELHTWLNTLKGQDKDKAASHLAAMKSGRFIFVIGILCPFFWVSLFAGDPVGTVLIHFTHSSLFVIYGYFMHKKAKNSLYQMKALGSKNLN